MSGSASPISISPLSLCSTDRTAHERGTQFTAPVHTAARERMRFNGARCEADNCENRRFTRLGEGMRRAVVAGGVRMETAPEAKRTVASASLTGLRAPRHFCRTARFDAPGVCGSALGTVRACAAASSETSAGLRPVRLRPTRCA
jgi:hypothetical protein